MKIGTLRVLERMRFLSPKMYDEHFISKVPLPHLPMGKFCTELMLGLPTDFLTILTIVFFCSVSGKFTVSGRPTGVT